MRRLAILLAWLAIAWPGAAQNLPPKPPPAAARPVTTTYFGVDVVDPYRYMENLADPAVQAWISAQTGYARATLEAIPGRAELLTQLRQIEAAEPAQLADVVVMPGNQLFYLKEAPGRDSYSLYRRDGLTEKEMLLAKPVAGSSTGGQGGRIAFFSPSFDGQYVAYGLTGPAANDLVLRVVDANTGKLLPDRIPGVGFLKVAWLPDGHSFLYARAERPAASPAEAASDEGTIIYQHWLGTDPSSDAPVFGSGVNQKLAIPAGEIGSVETAPGSNYAVVVLRRNSDGNLILYATPLERGAKLSSSWTRIGNDNVTILDSRMRGNELFLSVAGLRGPVIARVPLRNPGLDYWGLLLQLSTEQAISGLQAANDAVYATVLQDGQTSLIRVPYTKGDEATRVALPFSGSVRLCDEDPRADGLLAELASSARTPAIYRYDVASEAMVPTALISPGPYDHPSGVIAINVTALSPDGTLVPLTIVYEKGLQLDGTHPALLMDYGSGASRGTPVFEPDWKVWLDRGGVLAFAELTSPGGIQDFLACAHYLIDQGYTTSARLAALGRGPNAIVVGRAITTEPALFRAVVIESGLLDPLRWQGAGDLGMSAGELGNTRTLEGFRSLEALSSYLHVDSGERYPAVLLETSREAVIPAWQSAKMAARLEASSTSGLPVLLDVTNAPSGSPASDAMRAPGLYSDEIGFLLWQLGAPGFQLSPPGR